MTRATGRRRPGDDPERRAACPGRPLDVSGRQGQQFASAHVRELLGDAVAQDLGAVDVGRVADTLGLQQLHAVDTGHAGAQPQSALGTGHAIGGQRNPAAAAQQRPRRET